MKLRGLAALVASLITAGQAPRSTIAFVSTRHDTTLTAADAVRLFSAAEIYLMDGDGTHARRLTENATYDGFPALSPDGRRIIFDSNRSRTDAEPFNTSDLFVMDADGAHQTALVRGSSATWSPDGKMIAFHASASGRGQPISNNPGAATTDSDIWIMDVDDYLAHGTGPHNITRNPAAVDDDPDWSPDGKTIAFTSHLVTDGSDNHLTAEIYVINSDGTGTPKRLTSNAEEERSPNWSPDGARILFACRRGAPVAGGPFPSFELCVINADGSHLTRLTNNAVAELTPTWSPDGSQIVFHRRVAGPGSFQLFVINSDGTGERQLTFPPGINGFAHWGQMPDRSKR